jgi:hypothetical protein
MKKENEQTKNKSTESLLKEKKDLLLEVATLQVNQTINPGKDTNARSKKQKRLAVIETLLKQNV